MSAAKLVLGFLAAILSGCGCSKVPIIEVDQPVRPMARPGEAISDRGLAKPTGGVVIAVPQAAEKNTESTPEPVSSAGPSEVQGAKAGEAVASHRATGSSVTNVPIQIGVYMKTPSVEQVNLLKRFAVVARSVGADVTYVVGASAQQAQELFPNAKLARTYRVLVDEKGIDVVCIVSGGVVSARGGRAGPEWLINRASGELVEACHAGKDIFVMPVGGSDYQAKAARGEQVKEALRIHKRVGSMGSTEEVFKSFLDAVRLRKSGNLNG